MRQHQAPQQQQNQQKQGMSRLEGCHKIALAKQRLTTAEIWNKYTLEGVESAERQLEFAPTQFQASRNEVDEAESALNEAYKKWEVIDVDEEGGMCESDSGGNRKREVSMSPAHGSGKKARTDANLGANK